MGRLHLRRLRSEDGLAVPVSNAGSEVVIAAQGPYGVHDTIRLGMHSFAHQLSPKHHLQSTLRSVAGSTFTYNRFS